MEKRICFAQVLLFIFYVISCAEGSISDQIKNNKDDVDRILDHILRGDGKGQAYNRLADLVDKFGNRITGSESLNQSIFSMKSDLESEGFSNVHVESVTVPVWKRGTEKATLLEPRNVNMYIMSVFMSPSGNVTSEVIVVKSFEELEQKGGQVSGKIVVYNQPWTSYDQVFMYRTEGGMRASALGATGVLIRSLTQFSIYSPHTGSNDFGSETPIPSACITTEDADMLQRMQNQRKRIEIRIEMDHMTEPDSTSYNVVADLTGTEFPDEYVLFGGHIDSWDVGVGAMDDGGGMMVTRQALSTVKALELKPRRTMRLVFWTAEEIGVVGAKKYFNDHQDLIPKISFALESDFGTFDALGLGMHNATGNAHQIIQDILNTYLGDYGITDVDTGGGGIADISDFIAHGVPGAALKTSNDKYFYFHHTEGDRMTVQDSDAMDRCSALITVATYVVANLDNRLPRGEDIVRDVAAQVQAQQIWIVSSLALLAVLITNVRF